MHATEMKTKRHYTAPVTQRATVELEGGFCGSIMENKGGVKANGHEMGHDYEFDLSGTGGTMDDAAADGISISWSWD